MVHKGGSEEYLLLLSSVLLCAQLFGHVQFFVTPQAAAH